MPVSDRVGDVVPHVVGAHLDGRREVDHAAASDMAQDAGVGGKLPYVSFISTDAMLEATSTVGWATVRKCPLA
jgi:hypothetical protein